MDGGSLAPPMLEAKGPASIGGPRSALLRSIERDRDADLPPPPSEPPVSEPPPASVAPVVDFAKTQVDAFVPLAPASAPEEIPTTGWTAPPPAVEAAPIEEEDEAKVFASTEEAKADLAATIVETPKVDLTATVVQGSSEAEKIEAKEEEPAKAEEPPKAEEPAPQPSFAKTLAFGSKLDMLPQSERVEVTEPAKETKESRKELRERLREQRVQAQEAQKAVSPKEDPDEISVPPANDLDNDDEKFFSDADIAVRKSVHEFEMLARLEAEESVPEKARRKLDPHVVRRRERFAGYVKIAVAGAAIVCLAAVGRSAIHSRTASKAPTQTQTIAAAPEAPVAAVTPKAAEPAAAPVDTKPAEAKPEEPKAVEPAAAAPEPAAPAKAEEVTGDAKEELKKSRVALEKRKIPEAIEAGERSVTLDPTDGEAWLILGAAYQEKGDMVNARRCYGACVKQGKTGPRLECQKMLRF